MRRLRRADGLKAQQEKREEDSAPLRARLEVLDDLFADHRRQMERLLDLYLTGDFSREALTERRTRLQTTIDALERERAGLVAPLEEQTITDERIEGIVDYARLVARGIEAAEHDFDKRRQLIEALDVRARLAVEDGKQVAYVQCLLGESRLASTLEEKSCLAAQPDGEPSLSLANSTIPATIPPKCLPNK